MLKIKHSFPVNLAYPLEKLGNPEKLLFFDIETTGLSRQSCSIYLIGCVYWKAGLFHCIQWFLEDQNEEKDLLQSFYEFALNYDVLIHFNGDMFDIPFVNARLTRHALFGSLDVLGSIDLYKRIKPLKNQLGLPNCRQKTIEQFLGICREDPFDGGQLIPVYQEYLKTRQEQDREVLLLHNREDIENLTRIPDMLFFLDLFSPNAGNRILDSSLEATVEETADYEHHPVTKLQIRFRLDLPPTLSGNSGFVLNGPGLFFTCRHNQCLLSANSETHRFRIYYPDYQNYHYLPEEDQAIHKSLTAYVDKGHRQKATRDTCYSWFQADDSFLNNPKALLQYVTSILCYLAGR